MAGLLGMKSSGGRHGERKRGKRVSREYVQTLVRLHGPPHGMSTTPSPTSPSSSKPAIRCSRKSSRVNSKGCALRKRTQQVRREKEKPPFILNPDSIPPKHVLQRA